MSSAGPVSPIPSLANLLTFDSSHLTSVLQYILDHLAQSDVTQQTIQNNYLNLQQQIQKLQAASVPVASGPDNSALKEAQERLEKDNQAIKAMLDGVSKDCKSNSDRIDSLNGRVSSLESRPESSGDSEQLAKLHESASNAQKQIDALSARVDSASSLSSQTRDALAQSLDARSAADRAVQDRLDRLQQQHAELDERVKRELKELSSRHMQPQPAQAHSLALSSPSAAGGSALAIAALQSSAQAAADQAARALSASQENGRRIKALGSELSALGERVSALESALERERALAAERERLAAEQRADQERCSAEAAQAITEANFVASDQNDNVNSQEGDKLRSILAAVQRQLSALESRMPDSSVLQRILAELTVLSKDQKQLESELKRQLATNSSRFDSIESMIQLKADQRQMDLALDLGQQQRELLKKNVNDIQKRLDELMGTMEIFGNEINRIGALKVENNGAAVEQPKSSGAAAPVVAASPVAAAPAVSVSVPFSPVSLTSPSSISRSELASLRTWVENELNSMWNRDKSLRGEIHELHSKSSATNQRINETMKLQQSMKDAIEELYSMFKRIEPEFATRLLALEKALKNGFELRFDHLTIQLRDVERAADKNLKQELKRFERDVLMFLDQSHGQDTEAAAGKLHFRCISCNQFTNSLSGPSSLLYQKAVAQPPQALPLPLPSGTTHMTVDLGKEIFISGRDGNLYRGRTDTQVLLTPGDPNRSSQFQVSYIDRNGGAPTQPSIVTNPSVHILTNAGSKSFSATATAALPALPLPVQSSTQLLTSTTSVYGSGSQSARLPHRPNTAPYHELSHAQGASNRGKGKLKPHPPAIKEGKESGAGQPANAWIEESKQ